ncbi:hypothetical protein Dimus_039086 [Dionaea muscipula]
MADNQSNTTSPVVTTITNSTTTTLPLYAINVCSQVTEQLTSSNYPQWKAQFEALLIGYDLLGYVDGTISCPSSDLTSPSASTTPAASTMTAHHWLRQDKLLLSAIFLAVTSSIKPLIATATTSHQAWLKLNTLYASKSRTRVLQLKEDLATMHRGSKSVSEYMHSIKRLADELALIDRPLTDDDITLYILQGIGPDFRDIVGSIRVREKSLTFEELHDLLVGHESYLRRMDTACQPLLATANFSNKRSTSGGGTRPPGFLSFRPLNSSSPVSHKPSDGQQNRSIFTGYKGKCQLCGIVGHSAKRCRKFVLSEVVANCSTTYSSVPDKWLMDSGASHNITSDLSKLTIHSEYDGTDEVVLGNGSGMPVSHIGSIQLQSLSHTFNLNNTLYVPQIKKISSPFITSLKIIIPLLNFTRIISW